MTIARYCELMKVEFSDYVILAGSILEARGYQFCIDYGHENAIQKAEEVLEFEFVVQKII